jgi:F-type H+-transporting ATPase subunit epsilon
MKSFNLEILTPLARYPRQEVTALDVPAEQGRLTVLAGHQPLVCGLRQGRIRVERTDGTREQWQIEEGFMTVLREGVTLLVGAADRRGEPA